MTGDAPLRKCPTCGGAWPDDNAHSLRRLDFLDHLPRGVTPTNIDALMHSDTGGVDRFLIIETKQEGEPIKFGQERAYRALASLPGVAVYVLRGTRDNIRVQRVRSTGLGDARPTTTERIHDVVADWLRRSA